MWVKQLWYSDAINLYTINTYLKDIAFATVPVEQDVFKTDPDLSAPWMNSPYVLRHAPSLSEGTGGR